MRSSGEKAFVLVEILVVVGLIGILLSAGIVPVMYSARLLTVARAAFAEENRERFAVNRIILDVREVLTLNETSVVKLTHKDELGGANDRLSIWTITPTYSGAPAGTVVFGTPPRNILGDDYSEGLYRWLLSDDKRPDMAADDDLTAELGRLVLPGVKGVRFSILDGSVWVDDYNGGMPQALRIHLMYGDDEAEKIYDVWMPKF
ncbi:MAG: type II secretion system GspH family protein [Synergistaceae bacterium]|jgi:type II secretory pathway pseudopilin PulG|nr:type II secretion system GspH family protein [Synergistaceae bacterium]